MAVNWNWNWNWKCWGMNHQHTYQFYSTYREVIFIKMKQQTDWNLCMKNYIYWSIEAICPSFMIDHYVLHALPLSKTIMYYMPYHPEMPLLYDVSSGWFIMQGLFWSLAFSQWSISKRKFCPCIHYGKRMMFLTFNCSRSAYIIYHIVYDT